MVEKAVNKLVKLICTNMDKDDLEVVSYGMFIIIFSFLEVLIILSVAIYFGKAFEAIVFLIVLMFLRKRVGGIHSNSYYQCMILTFVICFLSIGINEVIYIYGNELISKFILLIGSLLVLIFAPKDTDNRKFSENERVSFRIKSLEALCVVILLSYLLSLFSERLSGIINVTVLVQGLVIINIRRLLLWKRNSLKN